MKVKFLAIIISIIAGSCIEYYKVSTKINPDGSLTRTIQVVSDSNSFFEGNLKVPADSSLWKISGKWIHMVPGDTSSEKKYEYTATRHFNNVAELNDFLKIDSDTTKEVETKVEFRKKFRWFYTFIIFSETYLKEMPFNHAEIDEYMSEGEYSFFYDDEYTYNRENDSLIHIADLTVIPELSPDDSIRVEELEEEIMLKFSDWFVRNVFEEYTDLVLNATKESMPEKHKVLIDNKEELYKKFDLKELILFESKDDDTPMSIVADFLELSEDSIKKLNPPVFDLFYKKLDNTNEHGLNNFTVKNMFEMPGDLINTNADSISMNKSYWNYNTLRSYAKDYTLYSEVRIINKWAFVISGIVIIVLLGFLIKVYLRKNNGNN